MSKNFYHGIKSYYDPNESISIMLQIISSGGIKCRRLQGVTSKLGFNGDDYISVCEGKSDYEYRKYPNNAFFRYIYIMDFALFYLVIYLLLNLNIWIGSVLNIMTI